MFLMLATLLAPAGSTSAQGEHLVLAFYYAWFSPSSFGPTKTSYQPVTPYSSSDRATIERQVDEAKQAGIDAFIQSWYGPGGGTNNQTESNLVTLLDVAQAKGFRVAVDLETSGPFFKSKADVQSALATLLSTHATHPAYLTVNGKPVIFFWQNSRFSVADWAAIRSAVDPLHRSIWISEGTNLDYLRVFDGHHLYNIAWSADPRSTVVTWSKRVREKAIELGAFKYFVGTAMPGWDDRLLHRSGSYVRARANGDYFRASFLGVTQANSDWAIITSFNEWPEGSMIEPSVTYGDQYLNLAAELANTYRTTASNYVVAPTETPVPTNTPTPTDTPTVTPTFTPTPTDTPTPTPTDTPTPTPTDTPTFTPTPTDTPTPTPVPTDTPVPTNTPVKIVQALPNAAKVAAGGDLKLATPTPQPVRAPAASPSSSLPTGLIIGAAFLLVAAIVVGWTLGTRTRR
jgi:hypothetical protein